MATVRLRLFAAAREAAGTGATEIDGATLGEVLAVACDRFGATFAAVLARSRVWIDGDEPEHGDATVVSEGAEVAVLPPVSGG